jgi:hypothetical protein
MIVKNESHIIVDTLTKLTNKVKFDYYAISDTGSTDNTIDLIKDFFKDKIPGEIVSDTWENFGHNRSLALKLAYNKTDYVLVFDADDEIVGDFVLPEKLTCDAYMLKLGSLTSSYERMMLVKNTLKWKYYGVLHEFIGLESEGHVEKGYITGDYYIVSGRTSSRNKDPNKYIKDAEILEKGYYESLNSNGTMHHRYAYYCANSYLDAGIKDKAIEWYIITLSSHGWFDERYNACLKLYELYDDKKIGLYYLVESHKHNPHRVEGIFRLIQHYCIDGSFHVAYNYYLLIKDYYENKYAKGLDDLSQKLFALVTDYTFNLPYYMIIVSEKVNKHEVAIQMYTIIFKMKGLPPGEWWINNLLYNFQFFKKYVTDNSFYRLFEDYLQFLKENNFTFKNPFKKTIYIYTGFSSEPWNYTYSLTNAIGGSERAVIELSLHFKKDYNIVIFGDVLEENVDNVKYVHRSNIKEIDCTILIISRYISFFTLFPTFTAKEVILMAHDTYLLNNLYGCDRTPEDILLEHESKITSLVCLTEWHKNLYSDLYPFIKDRIKVINNGINVSFFNKKNKKPNSFVYSSRCERGLERLLELWPQIKVKLPDATLHICSYGDFPKNEYEQTLKGIIEKCKDVTHLGKLNQTDLYSLVAETEYWMYTCSFDETSCITAMEMLMNEVICLYYPRAGLTDTMKDYGIQINVGNEIETLIQLTPKQKIKLKKEGKDYAQSCSWENRALEWKRLMGFKRLFVATPDFIKNPVIDYISFYGDYVTEIPNEFDEIIYIHEITETPCGKFNYLNTEPLNIPDRVNLVLYYASKYPDMKIYDYSLSNIHILKEKGITNVELLEYPYIHSEVAFLKKVKMEKPVYDFGIICSASTFTNKIEHITPQRRKDVVEYLLSQGFKINIIVGYGESRDIELGKCKTILNLHGIHNTTVTGIFEHIRCNRLLYAAYNILSEESLYFENKYPTLKVLPYNSFLKLKNNKIYDCFIFYNELDMLEYRLHVLESTVDYFVLVESTLTFTGKPKELYYQNNKKRFERFNIIHVIVDTFPYDQKTINIAAGDTWKNEKHQRDAIIRGLTDAKPDDIIIISDVDEIPNPNIDFTLVTRLLSLEQEMYYYSLDNRMQQNWYYPKILPYRLLTESCHDIRFNPGTYFIYNAGWHLSYFGDTEFIKNKIKNFSHQEFNNEKVLSEIDSNIRNNRDLFGRPEIKFAKSKTNVPPLCDTFKLYHH